MKGVFTTWGSLHDKYTPVILVLLGFVLTSFFMKVIFIDDNGLWLDEAYTAWFADKTFYELWFEIPKFESHPPLYYSLVRVWSYIPIGDVNSQIRWLSLFLSIPPLFAAYSLSSMLGRKVNAPNSLPILSLFVLSTFPIFMWNSIEARPYMLFLCGFSFQCLAVAKIVFRKDSGIAPWVLFSFASILSNWSHSVGVIYTATAGLFVLLHLIANRDGKQFTRLLWSIFAVTFFTFPLLVMLIHQASSWSGGSWVPDPSLALLFKYLFSVYGFSEAHWLVVKVFGDGKVVPFLSATLSSIPLCLALFASINLFRNRCRRVLMFLLFFWLGAPAAIYLISVIVDVNIVMARVFFPTIFSYSLLVALGVTAIPLSRSAIPMFFLATGFLFAGFLKLHYGYKESWEDVIETVEEYVENGTTVYLLPNYIEVILYVYAGDLLGNSKVVALPRSFPALNQPGNYYPGGTPSVPGILPQDLNSLDQVMSDSQVIIVTRSGAVYDKDNLVQSKLKSKFSKQTVLIEQPATVTLYEKSY